MNARIGRRLKSAGDTVLKRLGISPSTAVRGLWEYVVDHQDDAAAIQEILVPASAAPSDEAQRKFAMLKAIRAQYEQTVQELGLADASSSAATPSWDKLRDEFYDEQLEG